MDTPAAPLRWDLFCRVVDNLGDAAVMWRLARQLAVEHRRRVRLHVDQPAVLRRLVPQAAPGYRVDGVEVLALDDPAGPTVADPVATPRTGTQADADALAAGGQVVVTGFHAALPEPWRRRMAVDRPIWINLEYLSAEDWIERFHRLPSTHADGALEHYFYPGFTPASGGLLREAGLFERRDRFLADPALAQQFLAGLGVRRRAGETLASLLCYPDAPLAALARQLAGSATRLHLLVPDGVDTRPDSLAALAEAGDGRLRLERIPFVPQRDYDHLLWSCDFNFVRGEDSLVRGLWSGRPFVWQIYRQDDDAHVPKLEAFLRLLPPGPLPDAMRSWNRLPGSPDDALLHLVRDAPAGAAALPETLVQRLANPDLAGRLLAFAGEVAVSKASAGTSGGPL